MTTKNRPYVRYASVYLSLTLAIGFVSYRSSGSLLRAILAGALASLVATFFLVRLDQRSTKRLQSLNLPDRDFPARISATGVVNGSTEEVISASLRAIQALPNFGTITKYEPGDLILARTRRSSDSWGEKISVNAIPIQGSTRLHVRSVPLLWTVTEDMRCNFQNVALVLRSIHRSLPISDLEPREYFANVLVPEDK